jgi:hypothetical protein
VICIHHNQARLIDAALRFGTMAVGAKHIRHIDYLENKEIIS